jgi:FADH2 O2-dependent halogenase
MLDLAVIGSGPGGALTALVARSLGLEVALLERGTHPRFAIGESSTPMANILLEGLARRYALPRLEPLARYGTWKRAHPELGVGPKRGFSFYFHRAGRRFEQRGNRADQLLAEASPHHDVADVHWYRADVDHFLVREAEAAGALYLDRVELQSFAHGAGACRLEGTHSGRPLSLEARFVVDASGPRGALSRLLGLPESSFPAFPRTQALFTHFTGVQRWADVHPEREPPPYPVDDAALHHVFDGGWIWVLRFDSGITSAGCALEEGLAADLRLADGAPAWDRLLGRLPSIREQFAHAVAVEPWRHLPRVAFRTSAVAGPGWAMLPSAAAIVDPLFSTGLPLTLLGVERIARALAASRGAPDFAQRMAEHARATLQEADAAARLVGACYRAFRAFPAFAGLARCYLASVSFSEICHRLGEGERAQGFLACRDPRYEAAFASCAAEAARLAAREAQEPQELAGFERSVAEAIEPLDVAGFRDGSRRNWYPVDFGALLGACAKLGRDRESLRTFLLGQGMGPWMAHLP